MNYNNLKIFKIEDSNLDVHYYADYKWIDVLNRHFSIWGSDIVDCLGGLTIKETNPNEKLTILMQSPVNIPTNATLVKKGVYKTTKTMKEWSEWLGGPSFLTSTVWESDI